jgi:hypothetical protein
MDIIGNIHTEKNRCFLTHSNENGKEYDVMLRNMEQEFLPTVATSLINIDYTVEAQVFHEAMFGTEKAVPPIFFPLIVGRNPEGPFDTGTDGMVATQMQQ